MQLAQKPLVKTQIYNLKVKSRLKRKICKLVNSFIDNKNIQCINISKDANETKNNMHRIGCLIVQLLEMNKPYQKPKRMQY